MAWLLSSSAVFPVHPAATRRFSDESQALTALPMQTHPSPMAGTTTQITGTGVTCLALSLAVPYPTYSDPVVASLGGADLNMQKDPVSPGPMHAEVPCPPLLFSHPPAPSHPPTAIPSPHPMPGTPQSFSHSLQGAGQEPGGSQAPVIGRYSYKRSKPSPSVCSCIALAMGHLPRYLHQGMGTCPIQLGQS